MRTVEPLVHSLKSIKALESQCSTEWEKTHGQTSGPLPRLPCGTDKTFSFAIDGRSSSSTWISLTFILPRMWSMFWIRSNSDQRPILTSCPAHLKQTWWKRWRCERCLMQSSLIVDYFNGRSESGRHQTTNQDCPRRMRVLPDAADVLNEAIVLRSLIGDWFSSRCTARLSVDRWPSSAESELFVSFRYMGLVPTVMKRLLQGTCNGKRGQERTIFVGYFIVDGRRRTRIRFFRGVNFVSAGSFRVAGNGVNFSQGDSLVDHLHNSLFLIEAVVVIDKWVILAEKSDTRRSDRNDWAVGWRHQAKCVVQFFIAAYR